MKRFAAVFVASLASTALLTMAMAAPQISPQRIIVNPVPTELQVDVWLDRSGSNPSYRPGDDIKIYTRVNQDAFVYLFNVDPAGKVDMILPNKYAGGANFLKANTTKVFPDRQDPFTFEISAPYGLNKVLALASKTELNLNEIARFQSGQSNTFAEVTVQSQDALAQKLSIIVRPVDNWITDVATYTVVNHNTGVVPPKPTPTPKPTFTDVKAPIYPGATGKHYQDRDEIETEFTTRDGADRVWAFYQKELEKQGYQMQNLDRKRNEYKATFSRKAGRDDDRLTVKLKIKNKDRYTFEVRW